MDYIALTTDSSSPTSRLTVNFEKSRKGVPNADDILGDALIRTFVRLSNVLDRQISAINNSNPKQTREKKLLSIMIEDIFGRMPSFLTSDDVEEGATNDNYDN